MKHLILIIGIISSILQACQLTEVDGYVEVLFIFQFNAIP